jgi:hypothetical protein
MSRPYCQFPLCALSFGEDVKDRLQCILAYSAVQMGLVLWGEYTVEQQEYFRAHPPEWCKSKLKRDLHLQIAIGCEELGIEPPPLSFVSDDYLALDEFVDEWEQEYGPDARVRIVIDWVFEALHGTGISYDELAVVAAIYSKIGSKQGPVRITREEIWRRSLGYKSERAFNEDTDGYGFSRTARQVRDLIDQLADRNFFARVTFARRETYYSNRLSVIELSEQIREAKVYRARARQARIARNAELTRRIQLERRKRAGGNATDGAADTPL